MKEQPMKVDKPMDIDETMEIDKPKEIDAPFETEQMEKEMKIIDLQMISYNSITITRNKMFYVMLL